MSAVACQYASSPAVALGPSLCPLRRRPIGRRAATGGASGARLANNHRGRGGAVAAPLRAAVEASSAGQYDQKMREGGNEAKYLIRQAAKQEPKQETIGSVLPAHEATEETVADVAVVGCGPSGLALAAELGERGLKVVLIGMESKFTNNYGVWADEFKAMGMENVLDNVWADSQCFFGWNEEDKVNVGRAYGRVARGKFRTVLLEKCRDAGVKYAEAKVTGVSAAKESAAGSVTLKNGGKIQARLTVLASGAVAGEFLEFEDNAPSVGAQTAYGIEAKVKGYTDIFEQDMMLFMDYRRHHTGLYDGMALKAQADVHPAGHDGYWGTDQEVPSFLYAMPLSNGNVFLEETALVAKPGLPFPVLKRRLDRRLRALGIEVEEMVDEEWSYIPVGGPLPSTKQCVIAFGAAANMIHPATGYSIARSLREAPLLADGIAATLEDKDATVGDIAAQTWDILWPMERQRQAAFQVFGMELLATLSPQAMNEFFKAFFSLPTFYWHGFLGSTLSSSQVLLFAGVFFVKASNDIRFRLMKHLFTNKSAAYMIEKYARSIRDALAGGLQADAAAATAAIVVFCSAAGLADLQ